MDFLRRLVDDGRFEVVIHSSRCSDPDGIDAIYNWLDKQLRAAFGLNGIGVFEQIRVVDTKPPAVVTLDDRALTFDGTWPDLDRLAAFQPWNKRSENVGKGVLPAEMMSVPMPKVKPPKNASSPASGLDRRAVEAAFEKVSIVDKSGAKPARISRGWHVPIVGGGEVFMPDVAFSGCGGDHRKIREVIEGFSCAYHEGKRGAGRHMTETCAECGAFVRDRGWRKKGCVTHARRWESILSSQGSLNDTESAALAEVREFLETARPLIATQSDFTAVEIEKFEGLIGGYYDGPWMLSEEEAPRFEAFVDQFGTDELKRSMFKVTFTDDTTPAPIAEEMPVPVTWPTPEQIREFVAHGEQLESWAGDIVTVLSADDCLRDGMDYDDTIAMVNAIKSHLLDVVQSAFSHPGLEQIGKRDAA